MHGELRLRPGLDVCPGSNLLNMDANARTGTTSSHLFGVPGSSFLSSSIPFSFLPSTRWLFFFFHFASLPDCVNLNTLST